MNRVLGDYMETMLYKVFVSIDEVTAVEEVRGRIFHIISYTVFLIFITAVRDFLHKYTFFWLYNHLACSSIGNRFTAGQGLLLRY